MDWGHLRAFRREANGSGLVATSCPAWRSQLSLVSARQKLGQAARGPRISAHHARGGRLLETLHRTVWARFTLAGRGKIGPGHFHPEASKAITQDSARFQK